jgi:tRNA(Ile)-lysidine synthase
VKTNPDPGGALIGKLQLDGLSKTAQALVAVSGGRDSLVLLYALIAAGYRKLVVCHLNHQLRGRASTGDARFVAALADKLGLECELGEADVKARAAAEKCSIETAARNARYEFFVAVAKKRRCKTVILAHHADDQVETFLFNLFRGAGRLGLCGMSVEAVREVAGVKLRIVRPMLAIWRTEIDDYASKNKISHREDASNQSLVYTRNRVRHELLPILEPIFGRDVRRAIWRTAEMTRSEEEWLAAMIPAEQEETLSVPELILQPVAVQRRRILAWLRSQRVPDVGFSEVEIVRSLLKGERAKVNLPGNRHARRRAKKLFLE